MKVDKTWKEGRGGGPEMGMGQNSEEFCQDRGRRDKIGLLNRVMERERRGGGCVKREDRRGVSDRALFLAEKRS